MGIKKNCHSDDITKIENYIKIFKETNPIRESILLSAIQALNLAKGSKGLDAGCGLGQQSIMLTKEVGDQGHVTGLDIIPEFINYANELSKVHGLNHRLSFKEGSITDIPFEDNTFDWLWSSDCAGYPATDNPIQLIDELKRVVKPGGIVAILAWSSQQLLPGYLLLEARLNAASSGFSKLVKDKKPEQYFSKALGWFKRADFKDISSKTLVHDVQAPLSEDEILALSSLFKMLWGKNIPGLAKEDWAEYNRLCLPDSPDFILNEPDFYAFYTYSMFVGKVS